MMTREDAESLHATGALPKMLMFWKHTPEHADRVGVECCSQWYPSPFTVEGVTYDTAEHFMMAGKATLFGDDEVRDRILAAKSPGEAKALGRQVRGFRQAIWDAARAEIVIVGNMAKFSQHEALGAYLETTGTRVLVEASPLDKIWGIGLAADDPAAADPFQWKGLNLLGFALMETRERLFSA